MKLSSQGAARIREKVQKADERDASLLVSERSLWRMIWPLVLIALIYCNAQYAIDFMIRFANPQGEIVAFGLNKDQLINAIAGATLIISASVLVVILTDQKAETAGAKVGKTFGWIVAIALMLFSIGTATSEVATKLQGMADRGVTNPEKLAATDSATRAARSAATTATLSIAAARDNLAQQQAGLNQALLSWQQHQAHARQQYAGDADSYAWSVNTTHTRGGGVPFVRAIEQAQANVNTAQEQLQAAQEAYKPFAEALTAAANRQAEAVSEPSPEAKLMKQLSQSMGLTVSGVALLFALIPCVLLEVVRYAGSIGTGKALKDALEGFEKGRGKAGQAIKDQARAAAMASNPIMSPPPIQEPLTPQSASNPIMSPPPFLAQGEPKETQEATMSPPPIQSETQSQALQFVKQDQVPTPQDQARMMQVRAQNSDAIADMLADAESGMLENAFVHHLRKKYSFGTIEAANQAREILIENGYAMRGAGGRVDLI